MRRRLIALTIISAFALGSCGVTGELKRPPPVWGEPQAEKATPPSTDYPRSEDTTETGDDP